MDSKTEQQYWAAKKAVALADRSQVGRISMAGADCLDLLHRLSSQDLLKLQPGQGARTVLTSDKGRIVDLVTVLRLGDRLLLLTSPEQQHDALAWLDRYTFSEDSVATDVTPGTGLLALLGPRAPELLRTVSGLDVTPLPKYSHVAAAIKDVPVVLTRGAEPCDGVQVLVLEKDRVAEVRDALTAAGAPLGIAAVGHGVYDILRIEAGLGVYGKELGEQYNPLEAQLRDSISFHKGCYIGQEVIARLDTYEKVQKLLVGLVLPPGGVSPTGTKLLADRKDVGLVTSATHSPAMGRPIALAYVAMKHTRAGTRLSVEGLDSDTAEVVDLPFATAATASTKA